MVKFIAATTRPQARHMATDRASSMRERPEGSEELFADPMLRTYYRIHDAHHGQCGSAKDRLTPEQYEHRMCGYKNHAKFLHDVVEAGGHIVAASDIYQSPPGLGLHQEMAVYQEDVKMPPMKVLQSATKWVADHFKMKDIGTIEAGSTSTSSRPIRCKTSRTCASSTPSSRTAKSSIANITPGTRAGCSPMRR